MLLQTGGMLLIYKIQQFSVQYKMRLAVEGDEASFEKLTLNISDYRNSRINSHEIYLNGNMYDVKSVFITGDKAELTVINDVKEKLLLEEIKDFLKKSNQSKKELPEQLQKILSVNYITSEDDQLVCFPSLEFILLIQPDKNILSNFLDNPSPPPKLV